MAFWSRKPKLNPAQVLTAKPVQLVSAAVSIRNDGGANLVVKLAAPKRLSWLYKFPEGATKTFELDSLGRFVWESCDGKTSVQQVIRRLSKQFNLNLREAEVATRQFIAMLMKKGLLGMQIRERQQ